MTQAPRRDLSVPLPVRVTRADGSFRHEYLVNVSETGFCLHMQSPVEIGEQLAIAFRLPSDEQPIEGLCKVVWTTHEGEVQPGRTAARGAQQGSPSSGSFRAVAPGVAEMQVFRDAVLGNQVGYLAADLHFATVLWVARIDTRTFDFGEGRSPSVASQLGELVDEIARRASIRLGK